MRRLPPFPELVAFEAVARHLSFTKAAEELCVTQSAVSHRVRRLEKHFGTQLVRRLNPGIALTDAGAALLPELIVALDGLSHLGKRPERRLRVAAATALCTWWLAGRLSAFMKQRPGLSIELIPIESNATSIPEVDIRILWVEDGQDTPSATQAPLFNEQVFPVCSPRLLPNKRPMRETAGLGGMTLLHKATHASGEWSWSVWLDRLGIEIGKRRGGELRFADMGLILSAAVDGSGVALSRSLLVHDALQSGTLTIPIADFQPMLSTKKHVARWRRGQAEDSDVKSFVTWMVAEAEKTLAETDRLLRALSTTDARTQAPIAQVIDAA